MTDEPVAIFPARELGREGRRPGLAAKMAAVQKELERVPRRGHAEVVTKQGGRYTYDYLLEADLMEAIRPLLAKRGIATFYGDEILSYHEGLTTVRVSIVFVDGDTGQQFRISGDAHGTDHGDKGANKAKTSAVRYLLWKTFLQPSSDDPEQENVTTAAAAGATEARRAAAAPARQPRRTGEDRRPAFRSKIAQLAVELDELEQKTPGTTFAAVCDALVADYQTDIGNLNEAQLIAVGQSLQRHLDEAKTRDAGDGTMPAWRAPEGLMGADAVPFD